MKATEKYTKVFGRIETLEEPVSWATGVSNMLEWLLWSTGDVLGITKTQYRKKVLSIAEDDSLQGTTLEEKNKFVIKYIDSEMENSGQLERYAKPTSSLASPREALRRAKFFSEDYLNKEFDIFWTLVSDRYLDKFYGRFIALKGGGSWSTHGNGGLFASSTCIKEMQMDNLSFNAQEGILIANELKLGGKKNPDQILKYALMYKLLVERGFVPEDTRFMLLFIGDKSEKTEWNAAIDEEISYCLKSTKNTSKLAVQEDCIEIARSADYSATTWSDMHLFNTNWITHLKMPEQQVEHKLVRGFNEALNEKAFMLDS